MTVDTLHGLMSDPAFKDASEAVLAETTHGTLEDGVRAAMVLYGRLIRHVRAGGSVRFGSHEGSAPIQLRLKGEPSPAADTTTEVSPAETSELHAIASQLAARLQTPEARASLEAAAQRTRETLSRLRATPTREMCDSMRKPTRP